MPQCDSEYIVKLNGYALYFNPGYGYSFNAQPSPQQNPLLIATTFLK